MLESEIAIEVKERFGGDSEIDCKYGCIDLLTESQVVEIKNVINWKQGLGQVLVYGLCYPEKERLLVLFNCNEKTKINEISSACSFFEVNIIFWKF